MLGNSLIKSRSMVHHKQHAITNEFINFGLEETSAFLKKSV